MTKKTRDLSVLTQLAAGVKPVAKVHPIDARESMRAFRKIAYAERTELQKHLRKTCADGKKLANAIFAFLSEIAKQLKSTLGFVMSWVVRHRSLAGLSDRFASA